MSDEPILYAAENGLATITINRPEVLNAFTPASLAAFGAALRRARDEGQRAILLTGAGRGFSAGMDLASIKHLYGAGDRRESAPDFVDLLGEHFHPVLRELISTPLPTVAAINGPVAGGGMGFACACDFRIAADNARFVTAFTNIALVPDCGLAYTLPRIVGAARATELMLLSEPLSAGQALAIGLVNRVVPAAELMTAATALASKLASGPTRAYAGTKALIAAGFTSSFEEFLARESEMQAAAGTTKDHRAAVVAFLAKQPPKFEGA